MARTDSLISALDKLLKKEAIINLHYIVRSGSNKKGWEYTWFSPKLDKDLNQDIVSLINPYLAKVLADKTLVRFDPTVSDVNTIDTLQVTDIPELVKIQESLQSLSKRLEQAPTSKDIIGYCFTFENDDEKVFLYKKTARSTLLEKGIMAFLGSQVLKKCTERLFIIDNRVDVVVFDEAVYVINRYPFESMFKYSDEYIKITDRALCEIQELGIIEGFEEFSEACRGNGRLQKQIVKMVSEDGIKTLRENLENIPNVIQEFGLDVSFEDGKMVFEEDNFGDIVRVITNVLGTRALDKSKGEVSSFRSIN